MTSTRTPSAPHETSRQGDIARGIMLVITVGAMCWVLAMRSPVKSADAEIAVPALPQIAARCTEDRAHAEHRSKHALRAGIARAQRYAFEPQDGLTALERFAEARACAEVAGNDALLEDASRRAARHRARVEDDYLDHVARYRLARRVDRLSEAQEDIDFLLKLLSKHVPVETAQLRLDQLELERQAGARERRR